MRIAIIFLATYRAFVGLHMKKMFFGTHVLCSFLRALSLDGKINFIAMKKLIMIF